ncbi:MAG: hypothetical protein ACI80H_001612 [Pseudoalteromonas distincta]|jgi:hypothetical protein
MLNKTSVDSDMLGQAYEYVIKQCYQNEDFKTIVTVGGRIPNNLQMEDEVLLQFYDIVISRV